MTDVAHTALPIDLRWFECDGLYMVIDRSGSSALAELGVLSSEQAIVADLVDAVLLDEQDPLLRCLDAWCGTTIEWEPFRSPSSGFSTSREADQGEQVESVDAQQPAYLHELVNFPRLTVSLTSLEGTPRTIWLAMDAETLANMPALPDNWQSLVRVNRHLLPCTVQLQKFNLKIEELGKIGPGGLILLPQSFREHWLATVHAPIETLNIMDVRIDSTGPIIRMLPQSNDMVNADTADDASNVLVELADDVMINELYMRSVWEAGLNMVLPLPQALVGTRVVVRKSAAEAAMPLPSAWSGTLMKVGEGYGVLLDPSDG